MAERIVQDATGQAKVENGDIPEFGRPRYSVYNDGTGDENAYIVICNDCSTRSTLVTIPTDEMVQHDAWHEETDE